MSAASSPDLQAVSAELGAAIRRDHAAMKANLGAAIRRQKRRRKVIRTSALSLGAVLILSGSALAAGSALGVIDLGGGVSAAQVSTLPLWDGSTGTFITGTSPGSPYIYHLTGGIDLSLACGLTDPEPTNNIYVTSTQPLASTELRSIFDTELSHETKPASVITKELGEGKLPNGGKWLRRGRYPLIGGSNESRGTQNLPAGVTGVSNGCPTPSVAGQPGTAGSPAAPGKAGVTVAPSDTGATP